MKAGKELDRLIATDVFGWKWDDNTDLWIFNHCLYTDMDIPNYSTEIADAWIVVEKFYYVDIRKVNNVDEDWCCKWVAWVSHGDGYSHNAISETAPLAICLAALKAVGVEVE